MKNFHLSRTISLAVTFCIFTIFSLSGSGISALSVMFGIGSGTTILFLNPRKGGNSGTHVPVSMISALFSIFLAGLIAFRTVSNELCLGLYSMTLCFPVFAQMLIDVVHATSDVDFLCERIQGWEMAVTMVEYTHTMMFMTLSLASFALVSLAGIEDSPLGVVLCVANALMMVYAYFRHMAVYGTDSKNSLRKRMKRKIKYLLRPSADQEITINYKMLYARMTEFMEKKKPFLNPNFCLDEMSRLMYTNSGYISRVINSCTGSNFSLFVNTYRVNYAMDLFKADNTLKVQELSQLSGFSTKVTFNMAFKLVMNETPGEWCRHYLESTPQGKALSNLKAQRQ